MFLISNNGNLNGKNPLMENNPMACDNVRHMGYDVKIDVWLTDKGWFLGNEKPQFSIEFEYLLRDGFWCQAKNIGALREMIQHEQINCFWHQQDNYTVTSKKFVWAYPGFYGTGERTIAVKPSEDMNINLFYGVCANDFTTFLSKY